VRPEKQASPTANRPMGKKVPASKKTPAGKKPVGKSNKQSNKTYKKGKK
jgi:hypothetical protein